MRHYLVLLRAIIKTLFFNFYYLPVRQAIKLPIWIFDTKLIKLSGKVIIDADKIYTKMINIGYWSIYSQPDTGSVWENRGGCVIFKGKCNIGASSAISVAPHAELIIGKDFCNWHGLKIIASRKVEIKEYARIGWNTLILDTNMHPLKDLNTGKKGKVGAPIEIGKYNWISSNCVILPGVVTSERVIVAMGTTLIRNFNYEPYCMYGGNPIHLLRSNVYRDFEDDIDDKL